MKRYPTFDYIRLALAGEVVALHIHGMAFHNAPFRVPVNPVPAFLAISGWMVLGSLKRCGYNFGNFWLRRALRVLPAFLLSLALVAAVAGAMAVRPALNYWAHLGLSGDSANPPLWSLGCEEIAYSLMCALALLGFFKRRLFSGTAAVAAAALYAFSSRQPYAGQHTDPLLLIAPFLIGCAFTAPKSSKIGAGAGLTLIALIVAAPLLALPEMKAAFYPTLLTCAGALGCLLVGCADFRLPELKTDVSYGLYVLHFPVLLWLHRYALSPVGFAVAGSAACLAIAYASAKLIEQPFLRLKDHPRLSKLLPLRTESELAPAG